MDYPHKFVAFHKSFQQSDPYTGNKTWVHSPAKINTIHSNDYYKGHNIYPVAIDDLYNWNNLDKLEPTIKHFNNSLDEGNTEIIYGTRQPDGTIKLGNGKHRIQALKNDGYTHAVIPVLDETAMRLNSDYKELDESFKDDYINGRTRDINRFLKGIDTGDIPYDNKTKQALKRAFKERINYLNELDKFRR